MQGTDRHGLTDARLPQGRDQQFLACVVDLVGNEDDRGGGIAQDVRHCCVIVRQPDCAVDHEQNHVGSDERRFSLGGDPGRELLPRSKLPSTGVDQNEVTACPVGPELAPIAGNARTLLHDGFAAAEHAVDQRRLPDIGTAKHGDDRKPAHGYLLGEKVCTPPA